MPESARPALPAGGAIPEVAVARRHRGFGRFAAAALLFVAAALAGGFLRFATLVSSMTPPADPRADGIVVLTGGRERIPVSLALLRQGRAARLLISGVHPATTADAIEKGTIGESAMFDCCIDLGRAAENTLGNAEETRAWAARHGFRSLIVVTSTYHLPRSMAELKRAMPGAALTAYPVRHADLDLADWWRDGAAIKVLAGEYAKYIWSQMRLSAAEGGEGTAFAALAPATIRERARC